MKHSSRFVGALALAVAGALSAPAATDYKSPIVQLLNSRAAGSPRAYAEAAEQVARDAKAGGMLPRFVIALVSLEKDAPEAARLSDEVRREYLEASRDKIRNIAMTRDNGMAWYLLSLEHNDLKMLERAAELKNAQALNAYGTVTLTRAYSDRTLSADEVQKVLKRSFECFKAAAAQKDSNGFYNLGMCYMNGYGCARDSQLAFSCFKTAAEMGHSEAINNLGGFYRDGIGVEQDAALAAKFFSKSAELDNPYGQLNLALALQRGDGIAKDCHRAFELLLKAARTDSPEAMNALGMTYYSGLGVGKDLGEAVRWYRKSAACGFAPAMDNLASCYDLGFGVTASKETATLWRVRAAAARGDNNAVSWLQQNGYSPR